MYLRDFLQEFFFPGLNAFFDRGIEETSLGFEEGPVCLCVCVCVNAAECVYTLYMHTIGAAAAILSRGVAGAWPCSLRSFSVPATLPSLPGPHHIACASSPTGSRRRRRRDSDIALLPCTYYTPYLPTTVPTILVRIPFYDRNVSECTRTHTYIYNICLIINISMCVSIKYIYICLFIMFITFVSLCMYGHI